MHPTVPALRFLLLLGLGAIVATAADSAPARKRVAIVMDDGPAPEHNAGYRELFAREKVHITFSHVGRNVDAHPELARAIREAGHEIINHSYTHPHLKQLADDAIEREVADTQRALQKATGAAPRWFWAPFLEQDDRVDAAVRRAGLEHFPYKRYHFIGSRDWEATITPEEFRRLCTTDIQDGTIILCHEWPAVTYAELPAVIAELKKQGVEFVTFSELEKK